MPWKDTCPMDQRIALVSEWLAGDYSVTELAVRYGVARKTIYKWLERYQADPEHGLIEHSRAPHEHGRAMAASVRHALLAKRRAHPHWGPKKLRAILARESPTIAWPAPSTIGDLLRQEGLSSGRRRMRHVVPRTQPLVSAQAPNDVWTADFKGWFRTADGTRCDPLTVIDAWSRFVLCCRIVRPPSAESVQPWFERAFREYGLPRALRTDNGPPFATLGAARLSRLAVWWVKLGIQLDRIDPGHPEQNARHERFHETLQLEAATPPAATERAQQRRFDRLRDEFNCVRPHEALGQVPPAERYQPSLRPYPRRLAEACYDGTHQVRRVRVHGDIKWRGELVFISEAVRGELVGLAETETGDWIIRFMQLELGRLERSTLRFTPAWPGRRSPVVAPVSR